jgi:hypothetical protein
MHTGGVAATEFGQAVRRWRDRVSPEAAGLPAGGQRRAAGLRREELALDCDILTVAGSGLHIMIYTAEPGTEDAERLALITVLGTQALTG